MEAGLAYAKRTDRNQREIVQVLRDMGISVFITSEIGKGFPDICCGYAGKTFLVEIKNGSKPPSQRLLTTEEKKFHNSWLGHLCILESVNDAIRFANILRSE
jgi:hypothetical protein